MQEKFLDQFNDIADHQHGVGTVKRGGCDLNARVPVQDPREEPQVQERQPTEAEKLGVSEAKLDAMKAYARQLVRQNPKIKESTVRSKVAQKFKLKIK